MTSVPHTFGALLVGGLVAVGLSGMVILQSGLYYKFYSKDYCGVKALVASVLLLDITHTCLVGSTLWTYLIKYYAKPEIIDDIPWNVAASIALTAVQTFTIHCFFAHRINKLSRYKWYISGPIICVAVLRLGAAMVTTTEMVKLRSFKAFSDKFCWVFTLGLASSSFVDVLITAAMCYLLRARRSDSHDVNHILDGIALYALENGSLTCAGSIASMACWLAMPENRIFLGLHFVIAKLYANSVLATLNTRKQLRKARGDDSEDNSMPVFLPNNSVNNFKPRVTRSTQRSTQRSTVRSFASDAPSFDHLGLPSQGKHDFQRSVDWQRSLLTDLSQTTRSEMQFASPAPSALDMRIARAA